jgi:NADPH:quinone reductase-like Zn-dependent oxidoreductase
MAVARPRGGGGMKAAVCRRYGPPEAVVRIEEVERPVPGDGEVLIAIRAASVNPLDVGFIRGTPWLLRLAVGLTGPKRSRPGVDVAGTVEAVGAGVTRFRPGDAVFGLCRGAFAEFGCARESALAAKPAGLSFAEAAAVPLAGLTALQGLRDAGRIRAGQKVLVTGAAGGIGTFAVQLAKAFGGEVTAACATSGLDLARSLGADRAIDRGKEDFTRGGERWDLIFDLVQKRGFRAGRRALAGNGILVAGGILGVAPSFVGMARWGGRALAGMLISRFGDRKLAVFVTRPGAEDLAVLAGLIETGQVRPVIDRRYTLAETAAAIRHVQEGHARGKVIIAMGPER